VLGVYQRGHDGGRLIPTEKKIRTEFVVGANCTRLYLGEFAPPPENTFSARNRFRNQLIAEGHAGTDSFWRVVTFGSAVYKLTYGTREEPSLNPVVVTSSTDVVTVAGKRYRGAGEALSNPAGELAGINELPLEHYLYGVVPRELGPVAFPEFEAQKAQAVAARTYAVAGLGKRSAEGYDLRATTDDQVYGGYDAEHPVSTAAVDATAGLVATFNGKLITANYHSTSGGHTADNEESFNSEPVLYLRGVPDAQRGRALEQVPSLEVFKAHANPTSLRAMREGDFDSNWGRLHRWTVEWTVKDITAFVSAFAQREVGPVIAINVVNRGPSGRVLKIDFVTENETITVEKDRIRAALRFLDVGNRIVNLPSTLFFVEPITDKATGHLAGYRLYGGGFGHGVGLSQTGAVGMAQKGRRFDEILKHYYRGIELTEAY
jgi:stage II sporulation protein D